MRVAIYARYSSDLQRDTSIEDQIRVARQYAAKEKWTVLSEHIYSDAGVSGASVEGRKGLTRLLAAAKERPKPFDVVLADDTSRISRDIAEAIQILQQLKFLGIRVIYISQGIDSDSEQADSLVTMHGLVDSLYLKELKKKIKRGLEGQLTRKFATGAKTYGYRTIPVLDPSGKKAPDGSQALMGKRIEIYEKEAKRVREIFDMAAKGKGIAGVAAHLNAYAREGTRGGKWSYGAVRRILTNERYLGKQIWGQRVWEREPGSRRKVPRALARSEWKVVERPDLRIISDDLWDRVQGTRAAIREAVAPKGLARGKDARFHSPHLFTGFMKCGVCGGAIVTVSGGKGSPRFGCARSWRTGIARCPNRLTIRAKIAEPQILKRLEEELHRPEVKDLIVKRVREELAKAAKESSSRGDLQASLKEEEKRLKHLVAAIEKGGQLETLLAAMKERETRIASLKRELAKPKAQLQRIGERDIAKEVAGQLADLHALLKTDVGSVKEQFRRLNLQLRLNPIEAEPRPYFSVQSQCDLLALAFFVVSRQTGALVGRYLERAAAARSSSPARSTRGAFAARDSSARSTAPP